MVTRENVKPFFGMAYIHKAFFGRIYRASRNYYNIFN